MQLILMCKALISMNAFEVIPGSVPDRCRFSSLFEGGRGVAILATGGVLSILIGATETAKQKEGLRGC